MNQVLFLDDDLHRIAVIRERLMQSDCDLTVVQTADECIEALKHERFDLVMLDHDLGGEIYCDSSREDCGMEVVRWLKQNGGEHGAFVVHTHNAVAAAAMFIDLKAMGYQVAQARFGSGEFFDRVRKYLGEDRDLRPPSKSIGDRLRLYLRSLRLGR